MDYINELHELCEVLEKELAELNDKIRGAGKMSAGDLEVADKLTHAIKSIKATIAMEDGGGSYGTYPGDTYRGSYRGSYARRRDSMGRYSRGYSREGFADQLHDLMQDAPNEQVKREIQRLADKVGQM